MKVIIDLIGESGRRKPALSFELRHLTGRKTMEKQIY